MIKTLLRFKSLSWLEQNSTQDDALPREVDGHFFSEDPLTSTSVATIGSEGARGIQSTLRNTNGNIYPRA